ncbi:Ldh family oxidoreductase [Streptomyces sp. NPDC050560]|uniref:Ldh family oxidoreductase n=1 Tax=Streptomyces sp. NPDC050560 TaxID=3365630 RepID=UPI0037BA2BC6
MRLKISEARALALDILRRHRFGEEDAGIVADHLVDAHLTGYTFAGLPRLLVVLRRLRERPEEIPGPVRTLSQTPVSAALDGQDTLGYVACRRAVDIAVDKARESGIAVVSVANAYYSGRSGYYTERAARQGLVALHASHASRMVAPTGGSEPVLGSNPFTFAAPTAGDPLVVDLSTAAITWGEIQLAQRVGEPLPEGVAVDCDGEPTTDPAAALLGAALPWGGHKGYALSLVVQTLGVLAGGDLTPDHYGSFGFLFLVWRPDLLLPEGEFETRMGALLDTVRSSRPAAGSPGILVPGERGRASRAAALAAGHIELPDRVYEDLLAL